MAINLVTKHEKQLMTVYTKASVIGNSLSDAYDFFGAKTVIIHTPTTVAMSNYTRSGTSRYGTPTEVEDTTQELTMSQDKSFALTIDKGNNADQLNMKAVGRIVNLQMSERAVPERDKYVLGVLAAKAGGKKEGAALTKATICDRISEGTQALDDAEVPEDGRTLWITSAGYKLLKHSEEFMAVERIAGKAIERGVVGTYDNMTVKKVPSSRMPANTNFIIAHRDAATAPVKLHEIKIHQDPPGINGHLMEGREYYDCFVFNARNKGVYVDTVSGS